MANIHSLYYNGVQYPFIDSSLTNTVANLANVASTGDYNDLSNKPTIPDSQVQTDWNAVSGMGVLLNKPTLANVATSGEYGDLLNTPNIPTIDQSYNALSVNAQSGVAVASAITNMQLTTNMVDVINSSSTNTTYPTASAVYNVLGDIESILNTINSGS